MFSIDTRPRETVIEVAIPTATLIYRIKFTGDEEDRQHRINAALPHLARAAAGEVVALAPAFDLADDIERSDMRDVVADLIRDEIAARATQGGK